GKQRVLVTGLIEERAAPLLARWPKARWHPEARIFHLPQGRPRAGRVAVTCAGTSDLPVAEEAALTAEAMGATVARVYDVGVAGSPRLGPRPRLAQAAPAAPPPAHGQRPPAPPPRTPPHHTHP